MTSTQNAPTNKPAPLPGLYPEEGDCRHPAEHKLHTIELDEHCWHCGSSEQLIPREGDRVLFTAMRDPLNGDETNIFVSGTVLRVWGTRAVNITVKTDDGRTFVRFPRSLSVIARSAI
jgi:hypothetical protein